MKYKKGVDILLTANGFIQKIPHMFILFFIFLIAHIIYVMVRKKRKNIKICWAHEIGLVIFFMIVSAAASVTVVPLLSIGANRIEFIGPSVHRNFIPFFMGYSLFQYNNASLLIPYIIKMILLFLPFGFFIPVLWNKKTFKKVFIISIIVSVAIELCQLVLFHSFDIDDIILSILGFIAGYAVFYLLNKTFLQKRFQKCKCTV